MREPQDSRRGCKGCVHFFVTYEPAFPYGCRRLGFKSRRLPFLEVEESSGLPCQMRQEKARVKSDRLLD